MHLCSLRNGSDSHLPVATGRFSRLCRSLQKLIIVSPLNKKCRMYFRSYLAISLEQRRQVESNLLYIIHPFSIFRLYWEAFMTVVLLLALIVNPLDQAFEISPDGWPWLVACIFTFDIICSLDLIFDFFSGYAYKKKEIVLNPTLIAKRQFTSLHFYFEVISCVPMFLLRYTKNTEFQKIIQLISLSKIIRIRKFLLYFERASNIWIIVPLAPTIVKYSIAALLLFHWTACIISILPSVANDFFGFGSEDYDFVKYTLTDFTVSEKYIINLYKAGLLLFNIHYGFYEPESNFECVTVIIIFIVGSIYVSVMIVYILQMMSSTLSRETKYHEIINQVKEYMRCKQLPINIQKRLLTYYEYRFQKKYFRQDRLLQYMSVRLKREINVYCYRRLIESVSIFQGIPHSLIVDIVNCLKEEIFLPNDIIVKANTIGDCMYFIATGSVCVTTSSGKEICHLYDGAYFGEVALLMKDQKRIANVYALEICEMYRLDRKHFRNCFQHDTDVYRKIEEVAQNRFQKTSILEELHKNYLISMENSLDNNLM